MRAVIYARYSSDNQREASIEDQVRECRARIEREGWKFAEIYSDRGISGAGHHRNAHWRLGMSIVAGRRIHDRRLDRRGVGFTG